MSKKILLMSALLCLVVSLPTSMVFAQDLGAADYAKQTVINSSVLANQTAFRNALATPGLGIAATDANKIYNRLWTDLQQQHKKMSDQMDSNKSGAFPPLLIFSTSPDNKTVYATLFENMKISEEDIKKGAAYRNYVRATFKKGSDQVEIKIGSDLYVYKAMSPTYYDSIQISHKAI